MSGETQFGECDICKKQTIVESKFYHYGFKCDCHSPEHFERVNYCKDCVPKKPPYTKVTLTDEQAQFIAKAVEFYQNNGIKHGHWIHVDELPSGDYFKCSECNRHIFLHFGWKVSFESPADEYRYCSGCGAKMEGDCFV